jgi:ribosome-associated heat shock protein Hsp15
MRIDRLLHFLRFARSRALAQRWIAEGHIRHNGARVVRQDLAVSVGDVLTLPLRREVLVIELVDLPARRGPASEARACYRALDAGGTNGIAGERQARGKAPQ